MSYNRRKPCLLGVFWGGFLVMCDWYLSYLFCVKSLWSQHCCILETVYIYLASAPSTSGEYRQMEATSEHHHSSSEKRKKGTDDKAVEKRLKVYYNYNCLY